VESDLHRRDTLGLSGLPRSTGCQPVCLSVSRCAQGCPCPVAGRSLRASCQSCSTRQMQDGSTLIWPGSVLPRSTGCQPVCLSVSRCAQGCPCPVAGRSLRASCPPLTRCRLRSRHPAFACRQRRLSERGQPLACPALWLQKAPSGSEGMKHRSGRRLRQRSAYTRVISSFVIGAGWSALVSCTWIR
jgi:hypothetical protein